MSLASFVTKECVGSRLPQRLGRAAVPGALLLSLRLTPAPCRASPSAVKKAPKPPSSASDADTRDKKMLSKAQRIAMKEEAARAREEGKKKREEVCRAAAACCAPPLARQCTANEAAALFYLSGARA